MPGEDLEKHLARKLQELYLSDSVSTVSQVRPHTIFKTIFNRSWPLYCLYFLGCVAMPV